MQELKYPKRICKLSVCGKIFIAKSPRQEYCGGKCRKIIQKKQNREAARRFREKNIKA